MAVNYQRMAILLQLCIDMIDITLTFHLMSNAGHLEHMKYYYNVINPIVKFGLRGYSDFVFLEFYHKRAVNRSWVPIFYC